jgi:choline dehydrogenase-like flavoprotein
MHIDARELEEGHVIESDLCIVGAGAAGITMAKRLIDTPLDVCLLESGGLDSDDGAQELYDGEITGLPYYPLSEARTRRFGGSLDRWGGYCAPLDPIVFQERPWVPHSGWPISREDLDPYYAAANSFLQIGAFRYDPEYWEEKINGYRQFLRESPQIANRVIQFSNSPFQDSDIPAEDAREAVRLGEKCRTQLLEAENITVITHANVTSIQTPPSASTVSGLQVRCLNGTALQVQATRYVLACGGIEIPRLLLNSNQYAPAGLGNQHDLVGRFFMEHPHVPSGSMRLSPARSLNAYRHHYSHSRLPLFHFKVREEIQRSKKILNGHIRLDTRSSGIRSAQALLKILRGRGGRFQNFSKLRKEIGSIFSDPSGVARGISRAILGERTGDNLFGRLNVITIAEQAPNPDSRVMLSDDCDRLGQRKVILDWQLSELDRRSVLELNKLLDQELRRSGLGYLKISDWMEDESAWRPEAPPEPSRIWFRDRAMRFYGVWHHVGTTRMADSPQHGVCDQHCKVHGIDNLYVMGASVFPTEGSAPATLTIIALAIRLADHLKELRRR